MIILTPSESQIAEARTLYEFGSLNNSITSGKSNIYGALGEILVRDFFGNAVNSTEATYDYDMIINGRTVDVKTKRTTVIPKPHYFYSIAAYNTRQKCEHYIFCRIFEDFSKGFLLGYRQKEYFFRNSIFKRKGEMDTNGFKFKSDCYNLPIGKLNKFNKK